MSWPRGICSPLMTQDDNAHMLHKDMVNVVHLEFWSVTPFKTIVQYYCLHVTLLCRRWHEDKIITTNIFNTIHIWLNNDVPLDVKTTGDYSVQEVTHLHFWECLRPYNRPSVVCFKLSSCGIYILSKCIQVVSKKELRIFLTKPFTYLSFR